MVIVAVLEIQIAVTAVNLPAMKALFTKITGSSNDDSGYLGGGSGGYKMSGYKKGSSGPDRKTKDSSHQRKPSAGTRRLGATLSESEEELVRRGGRSENIKVTTNVDVTRSTPRESSDRDNYTHFSSR